MSDEVAPDWAEHIAAGKPRKRQGPSGTGVPMTPVRFRLTPGMLEQVKAAAKAKGWTDSTWMRCAIAHRLSMTDEDHMQIVRRYGGNGPDAAAMTALRLQFHQLGGLLTQVAKVSRKDGDSACHANAERTLAEVREAIATVAGWQASEGGK